MTRKQVNPRDLGPRPPFAPQEQAPPGIEAEMSPRPDYGEESYRGLGRLKGKAALVTGADSGIGRAVALAFAREGADVAIAYLDEHVDAQETKRVVEASGRRALLLPGDLTDERHCREVVEATVKELGRLDVLVNNAAYQGKSTSFEELTSERVERTLKTNLLPLFNLTRAALRHLPAGGSIINTSSIQAYQPNPSILDYAVTKAGIVNFTKGLAQELIRRGIRVNSVAPGPVWTPLVVQSFPKEKNAQFGSGYPMERPAQPKELAPAFVFLASDESRYVNGEILGVTGGKPLM